MRKISPSGLIEQWEPDIVPSNYQRSGIAAFGSAPWFALLTEKPDINLTAVDRGLIIRSWRGRLGG